MKLNEAKQILNKNGYELLESSDSEMYGMIFFGLGTLFFWLKYFSGFLSPIGTLRSYLYINKLLKHIVEDPITFAESITKDLQNSRFVHRDINELKDKEIKEALLVYFDHICNKTNAKITDSNDFRPLYWSILKLYYRLIVSYLDKENEEIVKAEIEPLIKSVKKENNLFLRVIKDLIYAATGEDIDKPKDGRDYKEVNSEYKQRDDFMNFNEYRDIKNQLSKVGYNEQQIKDFIKRVEDVENNKELHDWYKSIGIE